jgi:hypothetical protein
MRHLTAISLVVGLSAFTPACGGTPHDSPDNVTFGGLSILSCPAGATRGEAFGNFTRGKSSDLAGCMTSDSVSTFTNDGAGSFRAGAVANVDGGVLEVLDVDGDGLSDIVTLSSDGEHKYIAFAQKDGSFAAPVEQPSYPFGAEKRFSIDGMRDAFVYDYSKKTVSFYDLASDGSTVLITTASVPARPSFADIDGDGNVDMAFAMGSTVLVELGLGHGAFAAAQVAVVADDSVNNVAFGDIDGDGSTDLIVETGSSSSSDAYALVTNKALTFTVVNQFAATSEVDYAFQDVTGDGIVDVILSQDAQIVIMVGKGDGKFADKGLLVTGPWTRADYAFADLNGDGKPDLTVCDGQTLSVLLRQ